MKEKLKRKIIFLGVVTATLFLVITSPIGLINDLNLAVAGESGYQVPDYVKRGDLMMLDLRGDSKWFGWDRPPDNAHNDHVAIYMGHDFTRDGITGVWFVDALGDDDDRVNSGVKYHTFAFFKDYTPGTPQGWLHRFGYVNEEGSSGIKDAAATWAEQRVGSKYQFPLEWSWVKHRNPDGPAPHNLWFCFELAWAAYYNQGIDIDRDEWHWPRWVSGNDIIHDGDPWYSEDNFDWY